VIIECTNCHARYQYDEDRFERKPSKKIKCAKCSTIFEIHNPAYAPKPVAAAVSEDMTFARRGTQSRPLETTEQSPIPREEEKHNTGSVVPADPVLPAGKRLSLAVINGADAGTVYRIEKPRVTIGRSGDLTIGDTEASRLHAAISVHDSVIRLEDLNSTNGTLVDGQRITAPVELTNQSEFQIGGTTIMLIVTDES
jgi:hypothetical protein